MARAQDVARWAWVGLWISTAAAAAPVQLAPEQVRGSRMALELELAIRAADTRPWHGLITPEYANGLPWEPYRFTLFDAFAAQPYPGWTVTLGTVGAMYTSYDGYKELAGVRQLAPATFPGLRLRTPLLAPLEVGAGFLLSLNHAFQPDRSWGVFELTGHL